MTEMAGSFDGGKISMIDRLKRFFGLEVQRRQEEEQRRKLQQQQSQSRREPRKKGYLDRTSKDQPKTLDDLARARETLRQEQVKQAQDNLTRVIEGGDPRYQGELNRSLYLLQDYRTGSAQMQKLQGIIASNPAVAEVVAQLTNVEDSEVLHTDPTRLLQLAQDLSRAAATVGEQEALASLKTALKVRVGELIRRHDERYKKEEKHAERDSHFRPNPIGSPKGIAFEFAADLTPEQIAQLQEEHSTQAQWMEAIDQIVDHPSPRSDDARIAAERQIQEEGQVIPTASGAKMIDDVWRKAGNIERLSVEKLEDLRKDLEIAKSAALPTDVLAATDAYASQAGALHSYTEKRLDYLAGVLRQKLEQEPLPLTSAKVTKKEFLDIIAENPGHLGQYLGAYTEMKKLMLDDRHFRDQVFLRIHGSVLTQRRESSQDNFGLYERADFTTFTNVLRTGLAKQIRTETGKAFGETLVEWYTTLSSTIRFSRDLDFYASQPAGNMEGLTKSLAFFQNEYAVQAFSIPAVEQAFRAYELTIRGIRNANDGYIPPALVEYNAPNLGSFWDDMAKHELTKMVSLGVVHDAERDKHGFHKLDEKGVVKRADEALDISALRLQDESDLEIQMYMTLAKGMGMASLRFLEYFANSKIPGSFHPEYGMPGFHSIPYEGAASALNYMSLIIQKFRAGGYKHFHLMNTLIPTGPHLPVDKNDADAAFEVYKAYRDGTFEEKYGPHVKRIFDEMNFSKSSSALSANETKWRFFDSTINWTDKELERIGGPTRAIMAGAIASKKVENYYKNHYIFPKYKEEFKRRLYARGISVTDEEFKRLWDKEGENEFREQINTEWDKVRGRTSARSAHYHPTEHLHHLEDSYRRAFAARAWVEMAMRDPLSVAHAIEIPVPLESNPDKTKKMKLHSLIMDHVLGITVEDLTEGNIPKVKSGAKYGSPTPEQRKYLATVLDLEGDLAAVRELAIQGNRELTDADFDRVIKGENGRARVEQAKAYWNICKQAIMGTTDSQAYKALYQKFGLALPENEADYNVNWHAIHDIDKTLDTLKKPAKPLIITLQNNQQIEIPIALSAELLDKDWDWVFSTDSIAFGQMNLDNLGSRHWFRRGGDVSAHKAGGDKVTEYLEAIEPDPKIENLGKILKEMKVAYQADDISVGWRVAGKLALATEKLYAFDYTKLASYAQLNVWKSRRGVAAWTANSRRKFADLLEHGDILPPAEEYFYEGLDPMYNIHEFRRLTRSDNKDVWVEILTLGMALAVLMMIWRGLNAPSEEDGGGGGGGGGHH